jgi:hypothetical protein
MRNIIEGITTTVSVKEGLATIRNFREIEGGKETIRQETGKVRSIETGAKTAQVVLVNREGSHTFHVPMNQIGPML